MRGNIKKNRHMVMVGLTLLLVAGGVLFLIKNQIVRAQTDSTLCAINKTGCVVYLDVPAVGSNINGQPVVWLRIIGPAQNNIGSVYLKLYRRSDSADLGTLSCLGFTFEAGNTWHASCDTMGVTEQQGIDIQVHARDSNGIEVPLMLSTSTANHSSDNNPRFGSFYVMNRFNLLQPSNVTTLSGNVNFQVETTGDLANAQLQYVPYNNPTSPGTLIELVKGDSSNPNQIRYWLKDQLNTADVENGTYSIFLHYQPLWSPTFIKTMSPIYSYVSIYNNCQFTGEDRYSCSVWSACTGGIMSRTCDLKPGCPSSSPRPNLTQTCTNSPNPLPCPTTMDTNVQWNCESTWSACVNGSQNRLCTANSNCIPWAPKPDTQTCTNNSAPPCPATMNVEQQWSCSTTWSACSNGNQTRSCTANSTCTPTLPMPNTRTCSGSSAPPPCTSTNAEQQWNCSTTWSTCYSGTQTRTCNPLATCTPTLPAPNTRTCSGQNAIPAPTITDPSSGSIQKHALFAVKGQAWPGYIVRVTIDGNRVDGTTNASSDGSYYYLLKTALSPGTHTVYTQALSADSALVSPSSPTVSVQLVKPVTTIVEPVAHQTVFGDSQRLLASVDYDDPQALVQFYIHPTDVSTADRLVCTGLRNDLTQPKTWNCTWKTTQDKDGSYILYARVKIRTGNWYASNEVPVMVKQNTNPTQPPPTNTNSTNTNTATNSGTPVTAQITSIDSDGDGLPDNIEAELKTNPNNPDTDGDGISDGVEVNTNHTDPLVANPTAKLPQQSAAVASQLSKIAYEEPIKNGTLAPQTLKVKTIENYSPKIGRNDLVISGVGPPNTFVTLYIYSTPIVVTTKTDESGNFTYTLDSNLVDGRHEVYVTVNDQTGKIQDKSSPLAFFVRRAQAVSETDYLRGDVNVSQPGENDLARYLIVVGSVVGIMVVILLGILYLRKKPKAT